MISSQELWDKEIEPTMFAVEGLIPEGLTILSAPQKIGKSFMSLQLCMAVATGKEFLGLKTRQGQSLYLALEDGEKNAKERQLQTIEDGDKALVGKNMFWEFSVPTLENGFIKRLDDLVGKLPELRLVVVDVYAMINREMKSNGSAYDRDYRSGIDLRKWANEHGVALVVITHTTKAAHDDMYQNTTGTNGVTGCADTTVTISKHPSETEAVIMAKGRKMREICLRSYLDDNGVWQLSHEEPSDEYRRSKIREIVLGVVEREIEDTFRASDFRELAKEFGISLHEDSRSIGLFLTKYESRFYDEDGVHVHITKNGTGSRKYSFWRDYEV